ncbi:Hypothetical protein BN2458_PEG1684 [Helicobacter typhlonius]|uniref:Uncharacterized protein n=1 Tax=Helicobacter typhlonius TaxID=76936 RepID=A0A0S4PXV8_9HELI|nr:Hypothetical protein BN2458_PEG1684 [Helicobacter typhlonius]
MDSTQTLLKTLIEILLSNFICISKSCAYNEATAREMVQ